MNRLACCLLAACLSLAGPAVGADPALVEKGHMVYQYWCASCHGDGIGFLGKGSLPGTLALSLKYKRQKPAVLEERTDLTPELVQYVVRHGIQAMPNFRKTEISDADLDAIASYLVRNNK